MTEERDSDVLVPRQEEVQMYLNSSGDVVIAREASDYDCQRLGSQAEAVHVIIPRMYIPAAIERLKLLLAEGN